MYTKIPHFRVPTNIRFDVPGRCAGQIVEVAYGGYRRYEHDSGDPYKRITDQNNGEVTYYKWSAAPADRDAHCSEHGTPLDRCVESHE